MKIEDHFEIILTFELEPNFSMSYSNLIPADTLQAAEEGRVPTTSSATGIQNLSSSNTTEDASIWSQSAHPVALFFLFLFRCLAIATYLLCGFFSSSYVFSVCNFLSNFKPSEY